MGKSVTWFDGSDEDAQEWKDLCPENEFRVVKASQLPRIVPPLLRDKANSALVLHQAPHRAVSCIWST